MAVRSDSASECTTPGLGQTNHPTGAVGKATGFAIGGEDVTTRQGGASLALVVAELTAKSVQALIRRHLGAFEP